MELALIGVGRVGGLVVDALVAHDRAHGGGLVAGAIAVDTAVADVAGLRSVPASHRVVVGAAYPARAGVDGDNELAASIAAEDLDAILAGVDCLPSHRADAFLVVAALGGGTGGGGAPVVARALTRLFSRPVYGLGVLPARDADESTAYDTARSLVTFVREVDSLVVDTGDGCHGSDVSTLARRVAAVFGGGGPHSRPLSAWQEHGGVDGDGRDGVSDASGKREPADAASNNSNSEEIAVFRPDVAATVSSVLAAGRLSVLSEARLPAERRLFARLRGRRPTGRETMAVVRVVRDAAFGVSPSHVGRWSVRRVATGEDTSLASRPPVAEAAWLVLDGPPETRPRHGVDYADRWLRDEVGVSLVGGDVRDTGGDTLTCTLLLSGVRHVPRLDDLWTAAAAQSRRAGDLRLPGPDTSVPPTLDAVAETVDPLF
ncbi:Tubulin/FtsZ family, GTPase domain [Halogranum gelatinilyticum]|uniref:Tubulin/FtsZ family, GTPase domain n=1 Tax=Halogranum gelatinilyticum TaxID=660521 RepID=A0A1G9QVB8_9EURY|nr:hypothetical protein [Halogranum gelatinilyticum]SDM14934.1 Tubulin/FtsZ family, GTPase domain [Halogranum gelatinilyticum]